MHCLYSRGSRVLLMIVTQCIHSVFTSALGWEGLQVLPCVNLAASLVAAASCPQHVRTCHDQGLNLCLDHSVTGHSLAHLRQVAQLLQ